ncbi:hypothetical protein CYMTET_48646 [Cymbomonas tetramitiformis]|uniref:Reverse transcriptase domain-containing protein n=1 Tax=Cymbomonas tetramitiformis TaxID=36881 RepID=A0AAE0EVC4_9CHLO|nr:hypothetical protein CYMTET_48646 [Cymbomonas tetramitiformis]
MLEDTPGEVEAPLVEAPPARSDDGVALYHAEVCYTSEVTQVARSARALSRYIEPSQDYPGFCLEGKSPRSRRVRVPNLDRVAEVGAWQGRAAPLADGVGRTFLSRDFDRKVRFLLGRVASGSFSQAELQGHADRNLRRMYDALFNSDAQTWGVDDAHRTSLMASILFSLPSVSNAGVRATFRSLIVQLFLHPAIEKLGFNRIVADDSLWLEKRRGYRAFVDQDCGHVVTTDLSLVRNPTIESLMARGTMFRAKPHEGLGAEGSMPEAAFLDLERALQAWRFSVSKALGVSDASALVAWVAAVRAEARTVIDSSAGGESFVGGCEDPHLVLTASDWRRLREVQRDFVITTVDKAAGNFCFVCKKHYMQKCLDELRHGVAYEATERSADDINAEGTALCRAHSITPQRGPRIPHFHIRVKLHKSPVGYRFVAGANRATLTPVSKWLSVAFRALTADAEGLWKEVVSQIPGVPRGRGSWIIQDSAEVRKLAAACNRPRGQRDASMHVCAFDFTSMYTTLCLQDLKDRLSALFRSIFQRKLQSSRVRYLLVRKDKSFEWVTNERRTDGEREMLFSEGRLVELFCGLVDGTFVEFGGVIYRQIVGIPMGTSCAGFIANLYCFTYELAFMHKLVEAGNFHDAHRFLFVCRYIDDLLAFNIPDMEDYLYLNESGTAGIYPKHILSLSLAHAGLWHLAVNGDGHLGALDDGMWLSLWYPSDGYCLFEGVGDSSAAGSFYVQCLGAFSPAGGLVVDSHVMGHVMGYWHLVVNGDGHWNDLDDGMWLSLWYPSGGYCLFEGVGDSSAAGSIYVQCLGAFSPAGGLVIDTHFMGYWHLVVNGDGHWNDLDDGMWLSLWYPSDGYCLFECVGDSSTARFLGVSWIRLTLAPSPCTVLMVITHAGGLAFFDLDMKYWRIAVNGDGRRVEVGFGRRLSLWCHSGGHCLLESSVDSSVVLRGEAEGGDVHLLCFPLNFVGST